jgi:hypothetical protein
MQFTTKSAYITKRFDVKPDGTKWGKEDFATLAGKTKDNAGPLPGMDPWEESIADFWQYQISSNAGPPRKICCRPASIGK